MVRLSQKSFAGLSMAGQHSALITDVGCISDEMQMDVLESVCDDSCAKSKMVNVFHDLPIDGKYVLSPISIIVSCFQMSKRRGYV